MPLHKKVIVISHERSGTHMLINTLAINFGYLEIQVDLDHATLINWRNPFVMKDFLKEYHDQSIYNIFKSHHAFEFFAPILHYIFDQFHVFYVYRDGRDVLTSFWYYLSNVVWNEGPRCDSVSEFIRTEPKGNICRYQKSPSVTMLQRWVSHVDVWTKQASEKICFIKYEDMCEKFPEIVNNKIAPFLDIKPIGAIKPAYDRSRSVFPWKGKIGNWKDYFTEEDSAYFATFAESLMKRLGYSV